MAVALEEKDATLPSFLMEEAAPELKLEPEADAKVSDMGEGWKRLWEKKKWMDAKRVLI
ncbi:hypothetical protein QG37_07639 [Candidozyma auris]|nr:hypothetical protein QG37_07639 [[Candida] auris]